METKKQGTKIYILYDCIKDNVLMASFNKNSILARVGQDAMSGIDVGDYCLKSVLTSDLKDEFKIIGCRTE